MRAYLVLVPTPGLDENLDFGSAPEPLQALVAELIVEALVGGILPRLARVDGGGVDVRLVQPLDDGPGEELRAVVRADVPRGTVDADEARYHVDDTPRANAAGHLDGEAFRGSIRRPPSGT